MPKLLLKNMSKERTEKAGSINFTLTINETNMKNSFLILTIFAAFLVACGPGKQEAATDEAATEEPAAEVAAEPAQNTLTEAEIADGWKLLFDGETSSGWRGYQKENFPAAWRVQDGAIQIQGSGRGEAGAEDGGDILYGEQKFSSFHFKVEWKVAEASNSGIFYLGQEKPEFDYIWKSAPEMQVLDNINHPDAQLGKDQNRQAGSLYDLIPAQPQNARPVGEWNQAEVLVRGNEIRHIQNGDTVVRYNSDSEEFIALIADSKWPPINPNWADFASEGYVGLQDHGDDVWFRNIKIKEL